jgi:hypothetical protein
MASFTTVIAEFSDKENQRTYVLTATHTATKPHKLIQSRRVPTGNQVVLQDNLIVSMATEDSDGNILPQRVSMEAIVRRPSNCDSADVTAALAAFRDFVASDEFTAVTTTQQYIQ